jgi:hypothetical protein
MPGSPPPIPHALQMRENCRACHAGPGAVSGLRTTHPERVTCRQCHGLAAPPAEAFARAPGEGLTMRAALLVATLLLLAACQQEPVSPPVLKITEHAEAPNPNAGLSSERFIGDGPRVEVTDYPARPRFYALARTPAIEKYPCARCHTMPIAQMRSAAGVPRRAHWDVTLDHAPPAVMSCATCHAVEAPPAASTRSSIAPSTSTTATRCARSATAGRPATGRPARTASA